MKEQIKSDLNKALKEKNELIRSVLGLLLTAILNKEKEKRYKISKKGKKMNEKDLLEGSKLTNEETIDIILSEIKKRKEAVSEFVKGGRDDLAGKEKSEIELLKKYLPADFLNTQLSEEKVKKIAREVISKEKLNSLKDIGKAMSEIMPKVKGRADGAMVSKIVKELLND